MIIPLFLLQISVLSLPRLLYYSLVSCPTTIACVHVQQLAVDMLHHPLAVNGEAYRILVLLRLVP